MTAESEPKRRSLKETFRDVTAITAGISLASTAGCLELFGLGGRGGAGGQSPLSGSGPQQSEIRPEDAGAVARTAGELVEQSANEDGRIIWIPEEAVIDVSGTDLSFRNVTVASNGAVITTRDQGSSSPAYKGGDNSGGIVTLHEGARVTGIEFRGPFTDYTDHHAMPGYVPFAPQSTRSAREDWRSERYVRAVTMIGEGSQVDSCELWGWSSQAIVVGSRNDAPEVYILSNSIHNNCLTSAGYGVDVKRGHAIIYRCYFDANRHCVNGYGMADASYTVIECEFGSWLSSWPIDMHRVGENEAGSSDPSDLRYRNRAGGTLIVRGCTFRTPQVPDLPFINHNRGGSIVHARIRGVPADGFYFENNFCTHESLTDAIGQGGVPGRLQLDDNGFHNIYASGNEYGIDGSTAPSARPSGTGTGQPAPSGSGEIASSPLNSQAEINRFDTSHTSNISIAPDPSGANRNVTRISVGQDETRGGTVAWAPNEVRDGSRTGENDPDAIHSQYYVYFPERTQMYDPSERTHGTKLPGFAGYYDDAGNGGREGNGYSWSARLQTDVVQESTSNSAFEMNYYLYHMDQNRSDGYGDIDSWDGEYAFGEWHKVDLYVEMNTPGENDGVLRGWMNDTPVYERTDIRFRSTDHPQVGVTRASAAYLYWGGSWGSPQSQNVYFKDFSVNHAES